MALAAAHSLGLALVVVVVLRCFLAAALRVGGVARGRPLASPLLRVRRCRKMRGHLWWAG